MSEVKRYAFQLTALSSMCGGRIELVEYTGDGMPYVLASDYDQLKAENERLLKGSEMRDAQNSELHVYVGELRNQLDEARELLTGCQSFRDAEINAWLGATKP